jgi:hypothetical protein
MLKRPSSLGGSFCPLALIHVMADRIGRKGYDVKKGKSYCQSILA